MKNNLQDIGIVQKLAWNFKNTSGFPFDELYSFQFQNGTIKRIKNWDEAIDLTMFQFQNGTIKRKAIYSKWNID